MRSPLFAHRWPARHKALAGLLLLGLASLSHAAAPRSAGTLNPIAPHELCDSDRVKEAVSLVYEHDRLEQAMEIAQRCESAAQTQGRPFSRTIATRIQAVVAMRLRDMRALKRAGEALVMQAQAPEYVADGHMFIAFACVFGGDTRCARHHVEMARNLFTELKIADALVQLQPIEQTLARLEAQDSRP
jgi:hypothetical protein